LSPLEFAVNNVLVDRKNDAVRNYLTKDDCTVQDRA
jgi:hypothetical protein